MAKHNERQAKKAKSKIIKELKEELGVYDLNISDQDLESYIDDIMIRYGVNILLQRMAPSIMDGLLPARRRALYTLFKEMKSTPTGDFNKVADIAGQTIGKYHPHGLASVESCITNMGQEWSMYPVLIDPQGNYGSILGAPPAAGRYIEGRLSEYAYKCFFEDFDEDVIDMLPNYTRRDKEPLYLPARYPNFLITGNNGIGIGFTSSVPTFNLREVFELTIALINNPDMTDVYLYPDSPRGYDIVDRGDTIQTCRTGDGTFLMRGRMKFVEDKEEKMNYIQITNVTEQTDLEKIDNKIIELIKAGKIQGVKTIKDDCELEYIDYKIILKPEANPYEIMETIYKSTAMQDTMSVKLNFAEKTKFLSLGIKDALMEWIIQREDILQRTYAKRLKSFKEREHTLEILVMILEGSNASRTADIFRNADNVQMAIDDLVDTYGITSYQAGVIAKMSNSQLTKDSRQKYIKELDSIRDKIDEAEHMVRNKEAILDKIVEQLEEGIKLFGKDRMCQVIHEDDITRHITKHTIVVTKKYIKKLSDDIHIPGLVTSGDEVVKMMRNVPNDGKVSILDKKGRIYNIPLERLLSNDLSSRGTDLLQVFGVNEEIVFVFWTHPEDNNEDKYLTTFTEGGIIKKTSLDEYSKLKMAVTQGAVVAKDDNICYASITDPTHKTTLVYMNNGYGLIMDLDNISTSGRVTRGFNHIKLEDGVYIQGICDGTTDTILVVTKKGFGKLCRLDDVDQARKKDDLTRLTSLRDDDEVIFIKPVNKGDVVRVTLEQGSVDMNINDIPTETRLSKGTKIVPVKRGTSIVKVSIL